MAALSRVREFFVIARQSAFTYKGRFVDVREIGASSASATSSGTVRRGAIGCALCSWSKRTHSVVVGRYEGATTDIFAFQDQIAGPLPAPSIRRAEGRIDFAVRKPPGSLRAYDLVLQAYPKIWAERQRQPPGHCHFGKRYRRGRPLRSRACLAGLGSLAGRGLSVVSRSRDKQVRTQTAVDAASGLISDDRPRWRPWEQQSASASTICPGRFVH